MRGSTSAASAVLVAKSRCHFVGLNLTTVGSDERASLTQSLARLSLGEPVDRADEVPVCAKDYATPEHVISRVEPTPAAPKFTRLRCASSSGATAGLGTFMSYARLQTKQRISRQH